MGGETVSKEDPFEKIAEDTIAAAEKVRCSVEDFYEGLAAIRIRIVERESLAGFDKVKKKG